MKRIAVFLLALVIFATSTFTLGVSAASADAWDGTETTSWYDSSKTTLTISSAEDLCAFVSAVNSGYDFIGKTVELACDIVWSDGDASSWSDTTAPSKAWTPIGNATNPFVGVFDGNGHTVSGLYIYSAHTGSVPSNGTGFFGNVQGATIRDLNIKDAYISAPMLVGAVVGMATDSFTMSGCTAEARVICNYASSASDDYYGVGGLAGYIQGQGTNGTAAVTVKNCAFKGSVLSNKGLTVGGIVGRIFGEPIEISSCMVTADLTGYNRVGGIVGRTYGNTTISECYAKCDIYVWGTLNYGGIFGGLRTANKTIEVNDSYYEGHAYKKKSSGLTEQPTRLGSSESSSGSPLGSVVTTSTYYTDSTNDNSHSASGNQDALPASVLCAGGFDKWAIKVNSTPDGLSVSSTGSVYLDDGASIRVIGASIRYEAPSGLRLLTEVKKDDFFKKHYNGDYKNYTYEGAELTFGTLLIPADMVDGELTVDTKAVVNVEAKKIYSQNENSLCYTTVLHTYPERTDTYNRDIAARSYVKYYVNGEPVYIYSDMAATSFYKVAEQAYAHEGPKIKEGLNLLLALGSVNDDFFANDLQRVYLLEYASPKLFSDFAAALESEGFKKHTNYEYSDNHFGVYYNDNYTVTFYYTPSTIGKYTDTDQSKWYVAGNYNDDWETMNKYVSIDDAENIMRVIVEKTPETTLPALPEENVYTRLAGQKNTIAHVFPTDSYNKNCMGYVIQLADGSFIIIDGGYNTADPKTPNDTSKESDYFYEYLISHKPASHEKPIIAAWILTHQHGDHIGVIKPFLANSTYANGVVLEQVIYNFMETEGLDPSRDKIPASFADTYITPYCPNAKIITAHTGYKFHIRNATISILYSIDDFAPNPVSTFSNNESLVFDVVIDGTQRLMITGDMFLPASRALVNMYGADLKSDVIQIAHHGNFGATPEVNRLIWPDSQDYTSELRFALLPNPKVHQSKERLENPENTWLKMVVENDGETWKDKLYAVYEILFDKSIMGSDVFYENSFTTTTHKNSAHKANGKWQVIDLYTAK